MVAVLLGAVAALVTTVPYGTVRVGSALVASQAWMFPTTAAAAVVLSLLVTAATAARTLRAPAVEALAATA